ncbi:MULTISPECIES: sugar O-acetyltransferase [Okeania]|uniref:Acetyltransferase n=1 Tax=Okeania hirsuta TaxID=1458930 RepID=A0A3N6PEZ5_9CYAN|nr:MULTISPECIES: sugar O-acetyltransferase [Okeania]NET12720.1 sugar O-acetyltransferase [Okeania sp. SIO1H6]NES76841.1 sugar O-acetyltransferase [Okeania sp. SIO1H4]NES90868.1 sugar O-acetyltransferase [Okeania sp. SIO2B9]NET20470.1 sugar O-acetyltransferase [Okeania sp. SIO1H5]NET78243.1 sugar O-acetyltransferase [Okeania sp. SIO1F9]
MESNQNQITEKQKMLNGQYYNGFDKDLLKDRQRAKSLCQKLNNIPDGSQEERVKIIRDLFQTDRDCWIESPFKCDYGYNIQIGDNFYANFGCVILDCNIVKIGSNVKLSPNVQIYTATHPINVTERIAGKEMAYPIEIGDNVWIGGGCIILPGLKVGKNTVIGAGSVVTKDIPENVVAVGNPCRVIKEIE